MTAPLAGRVALVTGAGRGIGRATVELLAARGARVLAVARSADELEAVAAQTGAEHLALDLAADGAAERVVDETHRRLGPIAILVNNAAIGTAPDGAIWSQDPERLGATLRINLEVPFRLAQLASRDMRAAGAGRIVMVSSMNGLKGFPGTIGYTTSKHALNGLVRATAQDIGTFGGTCNAVCPAWVRTAMADDAAARRSAATGASLDEIWAERDAQYPRGRALDPVEIAEVIAFLCSDAASGVNGQAIAVDAGGPH